MTLDWGSLLNANRRKVSLSSGPRTEFERDFDRILFSTGVRRLADKTQVFPLEAHDSVRTRLTHSLEVSNIARSIGTHLAYDTNLFETCADPTRNIPALLAAVGLAHDLGNPPFGHQGETAMMEWFESGADEVFVESGLNGCQQDDFLKFDGNPQTLRLLTKLQIISNDLGLNLTYGTMAAAMKYAVPADKADKKSEFAGRRKVGFFQSEEALVAEIWKKTGLTEGTRHPLTYIVEATDDIAYSVVDAEDAVKKGIVSFPDLVAALAASVDKDHLTEQVLKQANDKHAEFRKEMRLSPAELNDISMQKFRVYAMEAMVTSAAREFSTSVSALLQGTYKGDLVGNSNAGALSKALKRFDYANAYQHRSVRRTELQGTHIIKSLMDYFWKAIIDRKEQKSPASDRKSPFTRYAYSLISDNYRRIFEEDPSELPMRYKELRLLTDMIAGMTDSFAMSLHSELVSLDINTNEI